MRLIAVMTAALLGGLFHPAPKPTATQVYAVGEWRLTVVTDTFTKQVRCRLENHNGRHPDVTAVPGALAFKLGRGVDTSDAWYRIDDQPARPWRDLRAELVATGSLAAAERLDNPSAGSMVLPDRKLNGATEVNVQPTQSARTKSFRLNGFWTSISSAENLGCQFSN